MRIPTSDKKWNESAKIVSDKDLRKMAVHENQFRLRPSVSGEVMVAPCEALEHAGSMNVYRQVLRIGRVA